MACNLRYYANLKNYSFVVIFTVLILVSFVYAVSGDSADDDEGILISLEELQARQVLEFVDPLGYEVSANQPESEDIPPEQASSESDELASDSVGVLGLTDNTFSIKRLSAAGSDLYGAIAAASGGAVIDTDKDNISSAVDLVSSALVKNAVIISRQQVRVNGTEQYDVYVDSTVTMVTLEVHTSCCKPNVTLTNPTGHTVSRTDVNVTVRIDTDNYYYIEIGGAALTGVWHVTVTDAHLQDYDVIVGGSSLVDIDIQFVDGRGMAVSGQPIPDSNTTFVTVTPHGSDLISNWSSLLLWHLNGSQLQSIPLGPLRGSRTVHVFLVQVTWPNQDVLVGVQGLDMTGHVFTRQQRTLVQPLGVRLSLDKSVKEFYSACEREILIPFTISNAGPTASFSVQMHVDNLKYQSKVSPSSLTINSNGQKRCEGVITLDHSGLGTTLQIDISVSTTDGRSQYLIKNIFITSDTCTTHSYETSSARKNPNANYTIHSEVTPSGSAVAITWSTTAVTWSVFLLFLSKLFLGVPRQCS